MIKMPSKSRRLCAAVVLGAAAQLILAGAEPAHAQRRDVGLDVDEAGRAVAIRNIAGRETIASCVRGTGTGRVIELQRGRGGIIDGVWIQDERFGRGFMNVGIDELRASASDKQRISLRLAEIMAPGNRVRVVSFGCGAAGRVEKLDAVTLLSGPAPRAGDAAPSVPSGPSTAVSSSSAATPPAETTDIDVLRSAPVVGKTTQNELSSGAAGAPSEPPAVPAAGVPAASALPAVRGQSDQRSGMERSPWRRVTNPTLGTFLELRAADRKSKISISCPPAMPNGSIIFGGIVVPAFTLDSDKRAQLSIDGRRVPVRFQDPFDDDEFSFSDLQTEIEGTNYYYLSRTILDSMANSSTIAITYPRANGRIARTAFESSGGSSQVTSFVQGCLSRRR